MSDQLATSADFELGRTALLEITSENTIGEPAGSIDEGDGTVSVYFDTTMAGYRGWRWTVSIAHVDGAEPTVLETELTPGDGALLSPKWVPWADRLAEYKETQAGIAAEAAEGDAVDDDHDDDDDDDDFDDDDVSDDDDALLHSGDLDGVDIDSLEDSLDEDDSDDDDDDDFDSAPAVEVDEAGESEAEPDDAHPEQPVVTGRKQRAKKQQDD